MSGTDIHAAINAVWRIESAKIIGALARMTRDVGVAEAMGWHSLLLLTGSTRESDLKPSGAPTFVQTDLVAVLRDLQG